MSDERPWYQNGWTMLFIILVLLVIGPPLYQRYQFSQLARIRPQLTGRITEPLFGNPELEITVWHQNAGNLHNGVLAVIADGKIVLSDDRKAKHFHSFEMWQPNKQNALSFTVPLTEVDSREAISISILLNAKNCHQYFAVAEWKGLEWTDLSEAWPALEKMEGQEFQYGPIGRFLKERLNTQQQE